MTTQRPRRGRSKNKAPTASIRYSDGSTREVPFNLLRLRDFDESEPWRRVRSVHGMAHYSGDYASATTGGQVVYESRLELARLLLADFDPSVCGIYAQPLRMVARIDGKVRSHVPDFLLVMSSGTVRVVNVKPASRLQDPKVAQALAWPGALIERHGWEYEIWSGAEPTLLENIRFLAAYRHPDVVPVDEVERAWQEVVDGEELALAERRLAGDREPEEARPALMALLWSGRLTTDLSAQSLSGECVLRRHG
ncbi:TnsA-like heteromeric transposase endonuclease subunit [Streptomyces sp. ADMS]|uniref:TnsA-like heteromeric transposase endonuclease subunit n=1 Tax=Streptomyces sp. ADMS TaxID=3071415 RepID=UPI00296E6496|nr:TnsA-like heteromeric transposase endonuclease subunit [Streptomyces sp. ADMS]MDW4910674.1 TnsA-like heteromeric transposase endonuclease subunit [Streptomyces sp. ADMS]